MTPGCTTIIGSDPAGEPVPCGLPAIEVNGILRCAKHHNAARSYAARQRRKRTTAEYQQKQAAV